MSQSFLLIVVLLRNMYSSAQQDKIDSILPLLNMETQDTGRVMKLCLLSYYYLQTKPDTAFKIAMNGLIIGNELQVKSPHWDMYPMTAVNFPRCFKKL